MVRPIAGKPFVVSRGFRLFRELFKFQDVEKLRDDRIYLAAVTGEIQGDAYTGQIGNVVVDFLDCLVWFFTSGIAPLHFCAESGGILGARGHDRPDTGILQLFSAKGISQNRKAAFTQNDQKHYVESLGGNEKGSHAGTDSKESL